MPQLDSSIVFNSVVLVLFLFWLNAFLFTYILAPLIQLRWKLVEKKKFPLKDPKKISFSRAPVLKYLKTLKPLDPTIKRRL
jgi:hypothetical protein